MTRIVQLPAPADFEAWRKEARMLLAAAIPPNAVRWQVVGDDATGDLFAAGADALPGAKAAGMSANAPADAPAARVPRAFIDLAGNAICHRDPFRFDLLYRLLWRLQREPNLMRIAADPDVHQLGQLVKAVRRDKHKMTAFLRFREIAAEEGVHYLAWFEPENHILHAVAPFFVKRFAGMRWSILTPADSMHWDGETVLFGPGAKRGDVPADDALEHHWRIYFSSIFNPARLNTRAMKREMPVRYWHNLPEAPLIPDLVRKAAQRTEAMLEASARENTAALGPGPCLAPRPERTLTSLEDIRLALTECRACELWRCATGPVAGEGPPNAAIVMVGEQPGDMEDLKGRPFVGPAGRMLDEGLAFAGLPRSSLYLTNAVKHFKFRQRGKVRLHQQPNKAEIKACRPWLESELALLRPRLIVALGATAAASLLGRSVKISEDRGQWLGYDGAAQLFITVHPSYLLRLQDAAAAQAEKQRFFADLAAIRQKAAALDIAPLLHAAAV